MIFKVIYKDVEENIKQKATIKASNWVSFIEELQDDYGVASGFEIDYDTKEDDENTKESFLNYIINDFENPETNYIITKLKLGDEIVFENGQIVSDD